MQLVLDEATVVADAHFCCCKVHKKLGRDVSLMSEKVGSIMGMEELVIFFFPKTVKEELLLHHFKDHLL